MGYSTLFVLGNGFDLAHGLPTKYVDFFNFIEGIRSFYPGHATLDDLKIQSSMSDEMYGFFSELSRADFPPYIQTIDSVLQLCDTEKINPWHGYFRAKLLHDLNNVTWIDFETTIEELMHDIQDIELTRKFASVVYTRMQASTNSAPSEICSKIPCLDDYACVRKLMPELTAEHLYQELTRYTFCFELYLRFYAMEVGKSKGANPFLSSLFANRSGGVVQECAVLSFNYTSLEGLYCGTGRIITNPFTHHIHGRIRSADDLSEHMNEQAFQLETPLVLGYENSNPEQNTAGSPFLCFEKFNQRIMKETGREIYLWLKNNQTRITAVFYGHSLDVSDAELIQRIFQVASSVVIYCRNQDSERKALQNLTKSLGKVALNQYYADGKLNFQFITS